MKTALCALSLAFLAACASTQSKPAESSSPIPATASNDSNTVYKVLPLKYASARDLAVTLRGALVTQTGHKPPQIVPDERTNSLVITCEPDEVDPIERLVNQLDVPVPAKK